MIVSADSHIDMHWLPAKLFVDHASSVMRERMPHVIDSPQGRKWVTNKGANFGFAGGVGATGKPYMPGASFRADRMASTGLYEDSAKGIFRLTDAVLRIEDQKRDGVDAEVLYGMLGMSSWIRDPEASCEVARIYNNWLVEFCGHYPERLLGLASIPTHTPEIAAAEIRRVAKQGGIRGFDISGSEIDVPLYNDAWSDCWHAIEDSGLPVHFHTSGPRMRDTTNFSTLDINRAKAESGANCQYDRACLVLREMILGGVLEAHPRMQMVLSESGIGWLPYMLERMDLIWIDQFRPLLTLTRKPSEYWQSQCFATFQAETFGSTVIERLGVANVMWASDFPHPDGLWPDSRQFIEEQFAHLPSAAKKQVIGGNASRLYGLAH